MKLFVIGSGSSGNCYCLSNGSESLIIEAGIPFVEVKKLLNFQISNLVGVLVTHSHLDHAKYVNSYREAGINVFCSKETAKQLNIDGKTFVKYLEDQVGSIVGGFTVIPFDLVHDVKCFGFLIYHDQIGKLLFATDTYHIPYRFNGLKNILIECNYRIDLLNENSNADARRRRVIHSHLEYDTCVGFLEQQDLKQVKNIVLLHLSDSNSHAKEFRDNIIKLTGKDVHVADKGLEISLTRFNF